MLQRFFSATLRALLRIHMTTRIYYPELPESPTLLVEGNSAHHLVTVLRRQLGDTVILFDGKNREYHTVIERLEKKRLWLSIKKRLEIDRESPLLVHLFQGISKGDRMDWVVQKAVELGVNEITPILTQHGVVKLDNERMLKKVDHWQNIAIGACEQCGRNMVPKINSIVSLTDVFLQQNDFYAMRWILHPAETENSSSPLLEKTSSLSEAIVGSGNAIPTLNKIQLLIGPEGGFSKIEVAQALKTGYKAVTLGPRILRTETAAIAAIAALQAYFENWFGLQQ